VLTGQTGYDGQSSKDETHSPVGHKYSLRLQGDLPVGFQHDFQHCWSSHNDIPCPHDLPQGHSALLLAQLLSGHKNDTKGSLHSFGGKHSYSEDQQVPSGQTT